MINRDNNLNVDISHEYSSNIESNAILIKFSSTSRLNLEKAKYVLEKELEALRMFPISSTNLKVVKSLMELDFFKNMNRLEKRSFMLAENFHLFGNLNFEKNLAKRIRKITQYDIMEISKKYLGKDNLVILNVYKK
jgi:predicted Zn-dependent peptidase